MGLHWTSSELATDVGIIGYCGRLSGLTSPMLTFLMLPENHWWRSVAWSFEVQSQGSCQNHRFWEGQVMGPENPGDSEEGRVNKALCQNCPSLSPATTRHPAAQWVWDCLGFSLPPLILGRYISWKSFSLVYHCIFVLTLVYSVNFHIHYLDFRNHHTGNAGSGFRLFGDTTEEMWRKWTGIPKGQDILPADVISHIAGHSTISSWNVNVPCLHLCPCALYMCVDVLYVFVSTVFVSASRCVCVSSALQTHRWRPKMWDVAQLEEEAFTDLGECSVYLCGVTVQEKNEEMMVIDMSGRWLHKYGVT